MTYLDPDYHTKLVRCANAIGKAAAVSKQLSLADAAALQLVRNLDYGMLPDIEPTPVETAITNAIYRAMGGKLLDDEAIRSAGHGRGPVDSGTAGPSAPGAGQTVPDRLGGTANSPPMDQLSFWDNPAECLERLRGVPEAVVRGDAG